MTKHLVRHARDCIQMIKYRKYIFLHCKRSPGNPSPANENSKDIYHVFMMKKGSGVTQEFGFEVAKMSKDPIILRVHLEEFNTEIRIIMLDKVRCPSCKLEKIMACTTPTGNCYVHIYTAPNTAWKAN